MARTRRQNYILHIPPTSLSNKDWFSFINKNSLSTSSYAKYYLGNKQGNYSKEEVIFVINQILQDLLSSRLFIKQEIRETLTNKEEKSISDFMNNYELCIRPSKKKDKQVITLIKDDQYIYSTHVSSSKNISQEDFFKKFLNTLMGNDSINSPINTIIYILKGAVMKPET